MNKRDGYKYGRPASFRRRRSSASTPITSYGCRPRHEKRVLQDTPDGVLFSAPVEERARPWTTSSRSCCPNCSTRSEEHTSELQSLRHLVCRLLLEKKKH